MQNMDISTPQDRLISLQNKLIIARDDYKDENRKRERIVEDIRDQSKVVRELEDYIEQLEKDIKQLKEEVISNELTETFPPEK